MNGVRFDFGKNWRNFLISLTNEQIAKAESSLSDLIGVGTIKNKTFLDIGCGSGLFSYVAYRMNAKKIFSFDYDFDSVECCKTLHRQAQEPPHWEIKQGSILDNDFVNLLGTFDIVYAWGVLHHTGKMWDAIRNAGKLVAPNGLFCVAIYNKVTHNQKSVFWLKIKKLYNQSPKVIQKIMEWGYTIISFLKYFRSFKNPWKEIKEYEERGMNWKTDMYDWMGGYPYEFATVEEIFNFIRLNFPNFILVNIKTANGSLGNNQFVFKRVD